MTQNECIILGIYIITGIVIGFVLKKWIMPILLKYAQKTTIESDDLVIAILQKWVVVWFFSLGLFLGLKSVTVEPKYEKWLQNTLTIFFVLSATIIVAKVISGMIRIKARDSDTVIPSSSIIGNIVKVVIYCIGILVVLQMFGISITPILTALGVGGLAVALALQDTLSNLFAGIQIIASGKINPGDFVLLDSGQEGFVQDVTWRNTTIQTLSNNIVIIPNAKLANIIVSNYFLTDKEIGFGVELGINYKCDLEFVETITKEVINETLNEVEGGVKGLDPIVRFYGFGESSIQMRAILRVTEYTFQFSVRHEFIKRLHKRFLQEGIDIPYPIRTVFMQNKAD